MDYDQESRIREAAEARKTEISAVFLLAGIKVLKMYEIQNQYWPVSYDEMRRASPWFLVRTERGMIEVGWRKRVLSFNWVDTGVKAVEYMTEWARLAKTQPGAQ